MIINWECAEIANSLSRSLSLFLYFGSLKPHQIIANFWFLFGIVRAGSIIAQPLSMPVSMILPSASARPIIWAFHCHYVNLCASQKIFCLCLRNVSSTKCHVWHCCVSMCVCLCVCGMIMSVSLSFLCCAAPVSVFGSSFSCR